MIVTTYCTAQSLILQLIMINSDELLVLLWVSVIEVTLGTVGNAEGTCVYADLSKINHACILTHH